MCVCDDLRLDFDNMKIIRFEKKNMFAAMICAEIDSNMLKTCFIFKNIVSVKKYFALLFILFIHIVLDCIKLYERSPQDYFLLKEIITKNNP